MFQLEQRNHAYAVFLLPPLVEAKSNELVSEAKDVPHQGVEPWPRLSC